VAFKAIADAYQAEPRTLDESLQARLKSLTKCVPEISNLTWSDPSSQTRSRSMGSGGDEAGSRPIRARRTVLDRHRRHQGTCGCYIILTRSIPGPLHLHIVDRFHTDRQQFESSIAVEKRLGLIVEQLKRMQNVMKTIKSGALYIGACWADAYSAQLSATTLYPRRPMTSSPPTPAA